MIYAILDSEGKCINRTIWDGVTNWQPPEGCTAVPDEEGLYSIYVEPTPEPSVELDLNATLLSLTDEQKQKLLDLLNQ